MRSPVELAEVIPHLLGFVPTESLVVVPLGRGGPVARIDLPMGPADRLTATETLMAPLARHLDQDLTVALVCFSDSPEASEGASQHLGTQLESIGISVSSRLWVTEHRWTDLATGDGGERSCEARSRLAAQSVASRRRAPVGGRDQVESAYVGDPAPVAALIERTRTQLENATPRTERAWVQDRLDRFEWTGHRLGDADAARLLVDVHDVGLRDVVLARMSSSNAVQQRALWADITARAPAELRPAAATAAGFAAWLDGDDAAAWSALDHVPQRDRSRGLAGLLMQALREGLHPSTWDGVRTELVADDRDSLGRPIAQHPSQDVARDPAPHRSPGGPRPPVR